MMYIQSGLLYQDTSMSRLLHCFGMAFGRGGLILHVPAAVVPCGGSFTMQIRYSPVQQTARITALHTDTIWCRSISSFLGLIVSTPLVDLFHKKSSLRHDQVQAATFVSGPKCGGYGLDLIKVRLGLLAKPQRQHNARDCHGA